MTELVTLVATVALFVFVPYNVDAAWRLVREAWRPPAIEALTASAKASALNAAGTVLVALVAANGIVVLWRQVRILPMPASVLLLAIGIILASAANVVMRRQLKRWESEDRSFRLHVRHGDPTVTPHRRWDDPPVTAADADPGVTP